MATLYPFSNETCKLFKEGPDGWGQAHNWIYQAALRCVRFWDNDRSFGFLRRYLDEQFSRRRVKDQEIRDAVEKARKYADSVGEIAHTYQRLRWPAKNPEMIARVIRQYAPLFDMTPTATPEEVLYGLFNPDDQICFGQSVTSAAIATLDTVRQYAPRMQFIVPNPMRGPFGVTRDGKPSPRCLDNVLVRRYVVVEMDDPELGKENQARIIHCLSTMNPLVMVVDSGGKSLHAWFWVEPLPRAEQMRFFGVATALGADPSKWDQSSWVRMPGGVRPTNPGERLQNIVFYAGRP